MKTKITLTRAAAAAGGGLLTRLIRSMATLFRTKRRHADLWPRLAQQIRRDCPHIDDGIAPRTYNQSDARKLHR